MNPLPTFDQIKHVKNLHSTCFFGPATISRMTGVPLRDIFRITRSSDWLKIGRDGTVHAGLHRLFAALRADAE